MRIRVTTRADLYEKRKQEHIDRGYRVEEEQKMPVNGYRSFVAVRALRASNSLNDRVAAALNANHAAPRDW